MKKKLFITLLLSCSFVVVGCSVKKDEASTERKEQTYSSAEDVKVEGIKSSESVEQSSSDEDNLKIAKTESIENVPSPWNEVKGDKLHQFVMSWGETMGQTYEEYGPGNDVDLYGLKLPKVILENENGWKAALAGAPISIVWSEDGLGDGYELVAVFSDAETQPYLEKHVYLFVIVSGVPKVLVTSQNQGNENNYLHFKETGNMQLRDGFSEIFQSQ